MGVTVDQTEWPLVTVRWQGQSSEQELKVFLARMDGWLERGVRFGLLIDARGGGGLSPHNRNLLVTYMKSHAALTAKFLVQAMVIDNLVQRTLFYAINLIFPNPFPSHVFSEAEPARVWLAEQLVHVNAVAS